MKDIYILGSGGFAKEVYFLVTEINRHKAVPLYNFKGFIDITEAEKVAIGNKSYPIIREDLFIKMGNQDDVLLAIGLGNPKVLEKLYQKFSANYIFPNLIHPNATGHWESINLGVGNIVTAGCAFTLDIKIGAFNIFNLNTTLGHDVVIGSFNVLNPGANISGGVHIGDTNLIGTNATILQNITVNSNSILGAGSVLTKNLDSMEVVVGIPAKPIKKNV